MSWQRPNIGSRVTREGHARFWERLEVKFLRATQQTRPFGDVCSMSGFLESGHAWAIYEYTSWCDLVGLSSHGLEKERDHALHTHCYRTCPFFCYGLDSSSGQHRCLKDHL